MTRSRALAAVALAATLAVAGCSSDEPSDATTDGDSSETAAGGSDTTAGSSGGGESTVPAATDCTANGEMSGASTATFTDEPTTVTVYEDASDFPPAVYRFGTDARVTINARSDSAGDVLISVDGADYTTETDAGLDIAGDGSGATVDAELVSYTGPETVTLTVTVTC